MKHYPEHPVMFHPGPTKRFCQTLTLKDDPGLTAEYRRLHSRAHHWRQIRDGIRAVGILEMDIYILGNRLFMVVELPADVDTAAALERLATLPLQAEWEAAVAPFQECAPDSTSAQKWQPMERMFHLYDDGQE